MTAVVVTGATRGIGAATALHLAKTGVNLMLTGRDSDALERVATDARRSTAVECVTVARDITDSMAPSEIVSETVSRFGRIDALVNNAAVVTPLGSVGSAEPEEWHLSFEVNLFAPLRLITAALPHLRQTRGRIINVCSNLAVTPREGMGAYCTSKAALLHLTRILSTEEDSVVSVAYAPGLTRTDMTDVLVEHGKHHLSDDIYRRIKGLDENKQMGSASERGLAISWLALNSSKEMSGRMIDHEECMKAMAADSAHRCD